ncbi:hypothetical protein OUZ56_018377 [Daphnia magna]|uniref:Uncharacterized protein n=1 Tax=Daphnia magna TaxID=35525 RepID=A0ABQ9Z8Q3_9CRUS|nr:hypothetical protein OUZ56_018377 [Daphnia magna]
MTTGSTRSLKRVYKDRVERSSSILERAQSYPLLPPKRAHSSPFQKLSSSRSLTLALELYLELSNFFKLFFGKRVFELKITRGIAQRSLTGQRRFNTKYNGKN